MSGQGEGIFLMVLVHFLELWNEIILKWNSATAFIFNMWTKMAFIMKVITV